MPANASDFTSVDTEFTRDMYSLDLNGIFGVQYDVTDQVRAETEIGDLSENLQDIA